jgi:hemoglobin
VTLSLPWHRANSISSAPTASSSKYTRSAISSISFVRQPGGEHFDAVAEDLMETLKEMGVSEELRAEVATIAAAPQHRKEVLNR